ncbi:hypothetical protein GCM10023322_08810 [Rugosimonospora acidiphila]|uniref:Lipoprotein signal peptidase n=1 Tax=Rugosimonospora acidiphila TaxID=556531 RepID=A0ABP9RL73_9ACTN
MHPIAAARRLVWLMALAGFAADQITKALVAAHLEGQPPIQVVGDLVSLNASRNSGAAFSFAPAATAVFTLVAIGVVVVIVRAASALRSTGWAMALGLVLAGAAGNLTDRLLRAPGLGRGAVVDFIDVRHFATFNLADACITCGAVLAVLLSMRGIPMTQKTAPTAEPA